jgi:hypothetical protein
MEIPNGEPARGDSGTGARALVILQEKEQGGWLCSGCHATVRLVGNPTHCPKCLRKVFRIISGALAIDGDPPLQSEDKTNGHNSGLRCMFGMGIDLCD